MKVPTAEEFLKQKPFIHGMTRGDLQIAMIEFARLHVKAAIEACIEDAPSGSSTDTVSYEDVVEALKDCYPESLVK